MPLQKPGLMLAIPTIGTHSSHFTQSKDRLVWPTNFTWSQFYISGHEVGRARNLFVRKALEEEVRYLFFWDEDVIPPSFGLKSLLFHMENHPEWTLATGIYATKAWPPEPLVYREWGAGPAYDWKLGECFPIVFSGLGFTLIRTADLELLMDQVEQYDDRDPWSGQNVKVPRFFETTSSVQTNPDGMVRLGSTEDAPFYKLLEQNGLIAIADGNVICSHFHDKQNFFYQVPVESNICKPPDAWNHEPRICNLGAGGEINPYELNVDLREGPAINFRCDVRRLPDEWADSFDVVKAHHVLEHFDYDDSADILREWRRILKPGGRLEVETPDLEWVAEEIVQGHDLNAYLLGAIYGDQGNEYWNQPSYGGQENGRFLPYAKSNNHHHAGFTAASLEHLFSAAGLVEFKAERRGFSVFVSGQRPEGVING